MSLRNLQFIMCSTTLRRKIIPASWNLCVCAFSRKFSIKVQQVFFKIEKKKTKTDVTWVLSVLILNSNRKILLRQTCLCTEGCLRTTCFGGLTVVCWNKQILSVKDRHTKRKTRHTCFLREQESNAETWLKHSLTFTHEPVKYVDKIFWLNIAVYHCAYVTHWNSNPAECMPWAYLRRVPRRSLV